MKTRRIFAVLLVCAVLAVGFASFSASAADGVVLLNDDDYTSSLGVSKAANASHSGGFAQTIMERRDGADGGGYAIYYPTVTGTNPAHGFIDVNYSDVYLNSTDDVKYFILELDVATETQYVDGTEFEFIGKDSSGSSVFGKTKPAIKTDSSGEWTINANGSVKMEQERGRWQHLTFVIETVLNGTDGTGSVDSMIYTYHNGNFVGSGNVFRKDAVYLHSLRISYPSGIEVDSTDTICVDNLKVTKITDSYRGNLPSILSDPSKSLTEFDCASYTENYVFPKSAAIAKIGDKAYSCVSDIEAALKAGDTLTVVGDVIDTLNVSCEFMVYNPDGCEFSYDASDLGVYKTDDTVSFINSLSPVEVKWHIGEQIKTDVYNTPAVITIPDYDEYQVIGGIQYKAIGFSRSEGGEIVTDLGYSSSFNNEFWLVYEAPTSYAAHSDGSRTYAYSDAEFDSLMLNSKNGDVISLLADTVACSTDNKAAYTVTGKEITIDLAGFELAMSDSNNYNMFEIGNGGKLTVKNGSIDAPRNGRIPEGATSIYRRYIFFVDYAADGAQVIADNLDINACKMIAVIKTGTATFKDCRIDFTKDYENMIDLYSSDNVDAPPTLNLIGCDIDTYKTVVNTYKPSSITENISVINITDCDITTLERIISAETVGSVEVNGGRYKCQYFFGKENKNPRPTVKISEGTEICCDKMDEKGKLSILYDSALARRNNDEYPYVVTRNYSTITWKVFDKKVTELWQNGQVPECPLDVPSNTREVRYDFPEIVPASGMMIYNLEVSANFTVKMAMKLGMNPSFNVYIPEMNINEVTINEKTHKVADMEKVLVDGYSYYKTSIEFSDASKYLNENTVKVSVGSAIGEKTFEAKASAIGYIEKILLGNYGDKAYDLALSALLMIREMNPDSENEALLSLAKYKTDRVLAPIENKGASISAFGAVISSVQLVTDGKVYFRINLNPSYSGDVSFELSDCGELCKKTYTVSGGKVDGNAYIDLEADAVSLIDGIAVSAVGESGRFDIYYAVAGKDDSSIVRAIYAYAKCASAYVNRK